MENKLSGLTEKELHIIRKTTKGMINQLLHDPVVRLKELAAKKDGPDVLDMFSTIFALEEILERAEREANWEKEKAKQTSAREQVLASRIPE